MGGGGFEEVSLREVKTINGRQGDKMRGVLLSKEALIPDL